MKDRQNPNLFSSNCVVDPVELETMDRRPTHIRKPHAMKQGRVAQHPNSPINFAQKLFAQTGLTFLIPNCGLERVLFSERKL